MWLCHQGFSCIDVENHQKLGQISQSQDDTAAIIALFVSEAECNTWQLPEALMREDRKPEKSVSVFSKVPFFIIYEGRSLNFCLNARAQGAQLVLSIRDLHHKTAKSHQAILNLFEKKTDEQNPPHYKRDFSGEKQSNILTSVFSPLPSFHITSWYQMVSDTGGDYYTILTPESHDSMLILLDVAGHGEQAYPYVRLIHELIHESTRNGSTLLGSRPGEILNGLNQLWLKRFPNFPIFSAICLALPVTGHGLSYANAGHLRPIVIRNSEAKFLGAGKGLVMGASRDAVYENSNESLLPGDQVVLLTDGLLEACNSAAEEFGEERLLETLSQKLVGKVLLEYLVHAVQEFTELKDFRDDATLLLLEHWPQGQKRD